MTIYDKISQMKIEPPSHWFDPPELFYWGERIMAQVATAIELSKQNDNQYDKLIEKVVEDLYSVYLKNGALNNDICISCEKELAVMESLAKENTLYCIAHAHLDMDWLWGYHETVAIVCDTARTMLDLMNEYPDFIYSQSQGATYDIIKKYDPAMFLEVKERIKQGRWEFAGSTWVELDKNMPNGESMSRHILYTRKFLKENLDIPYEDVTGDFHPDTFGHSNSIPEIFSKANIKYFYHCRGYDDKYIYRWRSQSGATVLAYNEPLWYNDSIRPIYLSLIPEFCHNHGIKGMIKIYGVGNHGGGPTRKDIETIIDMKSWPLSPTIKFSTYKEYFDYLSPFADTFPIVEEELNPTFTGCYTSESSIKTSNRIAEDRLAVAESITAISTIEAKGVSYNTHYEAAWKNVLFNHFHDILPGTGVKETKDHALGIFEETLAAAGTGTTLALRQFAKNIDTSMFNTPDNNLKSRSEGGGVGISIDEKHGFKMPSAERGRGKTRVIHLFNPTGYTRREAALVTMWDWYGDAKFLEVKDKDGNIVKHQYIETLEAQWNHLQVNLLIDAVVEPYGYNTYIVTEKPKNSFKFAYFPKDPRKTYYHKNILENDFVKATFDDNNLTLISLIDKENNTEMIKYGEGASFNLAYENNKFKGGSAWVEGIHTKIINLNKEHKAILTGQNISGDNILNSFTYYIDFFNSKLTVKVSLDKNDKNIRFSCHLDWHEYSKDGQGVPHIGFKVPLNYNANSYRYDAQFGMYERSAESMHDQCGRNFIYGINEDRRRNGLALLTNTKYGYRGYDNSLQVSILRGSSGPNKYPETGDRYVEIGVLVSSSSNNELLDATNAFIHDMPYVSNTSHSGTLPLSKSYFRPTENVAIQSIKLAEDDNKSFIIKIYDITSNGCFGGVIVDGTIKSCVTTDLSEMETDDTVIIKENTIRVPLAKYGIGCIKVTLL